MKLRNIGWEGVRRRRLEEQKELRDENRAKFLAMVEAKKDVRDYNSWGGNLPDQESTYSLAQKEFIARKQQWFEEQKRREEQARKRPAPPEFKNALDSYRYQQMASTEIEQLRETVERLMDTVRDQAKRIYQLEQNAYIVPIDSVTVFEAVTRKFRIDEA